jgi:hypothetical protein
MLKPKPIDRHMIRSEVRRDHPIRNILLGKRGTAMLPFGDQD